jgi:hypothetical protein
MEGAMHKLIRLVITAAVASGLLFWLATAAQAGIILNGID